MALATSLIVSSCGKSTSQEEANLIASNMFFENSLRVTVNPDDIRAKGIANFPGGCTGFFLKNAGNKNLIVSAAHCFEYDAAKWCSKKKKATDYHNKKKLKCTKVVAGDTAHDMVIFEFEASERDRSNDFQLADFPLEKKMMLGMLGFPADAKNAKRELKATDHCWVQNPASEFNVYEFRPKVGEKKAKDVTFTHNCSTYGGNSGGPMFIAGTRIAIGLPDAYVPKDLKNRKAESSAQGILSSGFIKDFQSQITKLKISIAKEPVASKITFLTEGSFSSTSGCQINIEKVVYNTESYPTNITISSTGDNCTQDESFTCNTSLKCVGENKEAQIDLGDKNQFSVTLSKTKTKTLFKRNGL